MTKASKGWEHSPPVDDNTTSEGQEGPIDGQRGRPARAQDRGSLVSR